MPRHPVENYDAHPRRAVSVAAVRWDELFADIESQLERELDAERQFVAVEEERLRLARLGIRDRMLALARGTHPLALVLRDGEALMLRAETVGRDWVAGEAAFGVVRRAVIVPLSAVDAILPRHDQLTLGLRAPGTDAAPDLGARLGLGFVLRDLCRRRAGVELRTRAGVVNGTIDRVARDHLDLAEHDAGEVRRDQVVRRIRVVPFGAILRVTA